MIKQLYALPLRIRWLIGTHCLLTVAATISMSPGWIDTVGAEIWSVFSLAAIGVYNAQSMLLAIWLGLGTSNFAFRSKTTTTAIVFMTSTHLCFYYLVNPFGGQPEAILNQLISYAELVGYVILAAAAFRLLCRFVEIRTINELTQVTRTHSQFALWQLFLFTAISAAVLALSRTSTTPEGIGLARVIFGAVVFLLNSLITVWAALTLRSVRWRFGLALLVGTLLELASLPQIFVDVGLPPFSVWSLLDTVSLIVCGMLPTAIAIASLLVVRPCGYRLVPKSIAATLDERPAPAESSGPLAT